MRHHLTLTLTVAFLIGVVQAAAGQPRGPKMDLVAGTGQLQAEPSIADTEWHVNAKSGPSGEDPQGTFFVRLEGTFLLDLNIRGRVTCLTVVGNMAVLGAEITSSRGTTEVPGQGMLIQITDNGEGNDDPPDTFNGVFTVIPPQICPAPFLVGAPITQGNFIVRAAVP
jgi:hypothetical protein